MGIDATTFGTLRLAVAETLASVESMVGIPILPWRATSGDLPFATVTYAGYLRQAPDLGAYRRESQVGTVDLLSEWEIRIYLEHDSPEATAALEDELVGAIVGAFDADETLGGACESCSAREGAAELADRTASEDDRRKLLRLDFTVAVLSFH